MQDDLIDLQTRLAFQEESIAQLNDIVTSQQKQLDQCQEEIRRLREQHQELLDLMDNDNSVEVPPHY
ncbi:MAG: SlyX family protein [Pseudohongiellaceae bacterium]